MAGAGGASSGGLPGCPSWSRGGLQVKPHQAPPWDELGRVLGPLPGEGALLPRLSGLSSLSLWSLNTFHEQGSNAAVKSVSLIHPAVELFMHDR